jgi:hypothetical protein
MEDHKGWGDSISFLDWDSMQITGHMTPLPEVGDYMTIKMESGKNALFKITKIEPCGNPKDQFFGEVQGLGYIEDIQEALIEFGKYLQCLVISAVSAIQKFTQTPAFQEFYTEYEKQKYANPEQETEKREAGDP